MKNFCKIIFLLFVLFFATKNIAAKEIYVNQNVQISGDCLTENSACKTLSEAMNVAADGDVMQLLSNVVEANNGQDLSIKWITLNGNLHEITLRWINVNLLGDVNFNNVSFAFLSDGAENLQKIFLNGNNVSLENFSVNDQNGRGYLPVIVAGSQSNTPQDLQNFALSIANSPNLKIKEIITSGLDGVIVPFSVEIPENVSIEKVGSAWEKSGSVVIKNRNIKNFEKIADLTMDGISSVTPFSFSDVWVLQLRNASRFDVSSLQNVWEIRMEKGAELSILAAAGTVNLTNLQTLGGASAEKPKIRMKKENKIITERIGDTEFFFEIDFTGDLAGDVQAIFVEVPTIAKGLVKWELKWLQDFDTRKFAELAEENGKTTFGLPAKNPQKIDVSELEKVLDEYDALSESEKDAVDPIIYEKAVDEFRAPTSAEVVKKAADDLKAEIERIKSQKDAKKILEKILSDYEALPDFIKKASEFGKIIFEVKKLNKQENPDLEAVKMQKENFENALSVVYKRELKLLIDVANNPKTTEWKTDESKNNLNSAKTEAQKIYEKQNATLGEIKAEIKKLDDAIKALKDGSNSGNSSSGSYGGSSGASSSSSSMSATSMPTTPKKEEKKEEKITTKNGREIKTKQVNGVEKKYSLRSEVKKCEIISNILGDYNKDFVLNFTDLDENTFTKELQQLAKMKIVNGTRPGFFEPSRGMTRAEFLLVALRVHCFDFSQKPKNLPFYDVDLDSWQANVVDAAYKNGIIKGYDKDENGLPFKPNNTISKIEALAILTRMRGIELEENFTDSYVDKLAPWQTKPLSVAEYLGILNPKKTNYKFSPNAAITRNEMVKMIVDIIKFY